MELHSSGSSYVGLTELAGFHNLSRDERIQLIGGLQEFLSKCSIGSERININLYDKLFK